MFKGCVTPISNSQTYSQIEMRFHPVVANMIKLWIDITLMCINQWYFMYFDTVLSFNSIHKNDFPKTSLSSFYVSV